MAGRPRKQCCDWFPHEARSSDASKTIAILENHFGAAGYAAWFKLLERLTTTNNHILDCRNPEAREYLAAKLRLTMEQFDQIFNKMAALEAIDKELWSHGFIWCQNLVDNLKPVYENRKQAMPTRPTLSSLETTNSRTEIAEPAISTVETPVSTKGDPPPKVGAQFFQYTPPVVEESRGEERKDNPPLGLQELQPGIDRAKRNGYRKWFDKLCSIYPKKDKMIFAEKPFNSLMDDGTFTPELLETEVFPGIERLCETDSWALNDGERIPKLEDFLDHNRWKRELAKVKLITQSPYKAPDQWAKEDDEQRRLTLEKIHKKANERKS